MLWPVAGVAGDVLQLPVLLTLCTAGHCASAGGLHHVSGSGCSAIRDVAACDSLSISTCHLRACRITLPPAVHEAAAAKGKPADWLYCSELLEQTGIVVVPGGCILVLAAVGTGLGCTHTA